MRSLQGKVSQVAHKLPAQVQEALHSCSTSRGPFPGRLADITSNRRLSRDLWTLLVWHHTALYRLTRPRSKPRRLRSSSPRCCPAALDLKNCIGAQPHRPGLYKAARPARFNRRPPVTTCLRYPSETTITAAVHLRCSSYSQRSLF